ncbi:MAG: alpha/beta hydrolase [Actinomycetota bacterium]|nr:alpha/beta hydrolase [Actinomycetota bacterium]
MEIRDRREDVAGIETFWREADGAPVLYVHGNPTHSGDWLPFLERTGGAAIDLPGFGRSGKPADFDYSIGGYAGWLEAFRARLGWDAYRLVVHDWGGVALAMAQREPERVERLVVMDCVPFLPGYRWHLLARIWRTRVIGELFQGATTRPALKLVMRAAKSGKGGMPDAFIDRIWDHYDHGTQRAILKLYRSAPPDVLARAGERLGEIKAPALVVWGADDPFIPTRFGHAYGEALGGETTVEVVEDANHWPWIDRPELVARVCEFLG